jgi:competence protein ComEC
MKKLQKALLALVLLLLVANAAVWQVVFTSPVRKDGANEQLLTVAFLDVGQGDAIYIEAPNGNQIVVDGGPTAKILPELGALMPWYDKSIDMIVITNPDKDHIAGFVSVLKRFDVKYLLEPGTENKSLVNTEVHELARAKKVEQVFARRGMKIVLDSHAGVMLTVLFPDRDVSKESSNDGSIVMQLTYGETEVMLTGDATSEVERHILSLASVATTSTNKFSDPQLQSDVLKVGHHGSKTSTAPEFVRALNPQFAVISSGRENKYGHPAEEVLGILGSFPLEILRTDQQGTIVMKSDGKRFWVEEVEE